MSSVDYEADENGYYEPVPRQHATRVDNTRDTESESNGFATEEYIATHRKQLEMEIQDAKEANKPSVLERYSYLWNLRDQLKPVTILAERPASSTQTMTPPPPRSGAGIHDPLSSSMVDQNAGDTLGAPAPSQQSSVHPGHTEQQQPEWLSVAPDCAAVFGEPWMVISIFVISTVVLTWGFISAWQYVRSGKKDIGGVWWQMSVVLMLITLMSMILPVRMRFGMNLYGIATVALFVQYGIFMICFPMIYPSSSDLAMVKQYVKQSKSKSN